MSEREKDLFCSRPFEWLEVLDGKSGGTAYMCCSSWLPKNIGKLKDRSVADVWNGPEAQEIRGSILDGSFRHCLRDRCPYLQTVSGPVKRRADVTDPDMLDAMERSLLKLAYGPRMINCAYDRSCNLSCPTCRTKIIVETKNEKRILELQDKLRTEALKDARFLYITGSGDPFGSPYFRRWLREIRRADAPALKDVLLHTNAQLWTEQAWNDISAEIRPFITQASISIDATDEPTYAINRRGGSYARLLENLKVVEKLRREGPLKNVVISMVVQENNFRQMPAFVDLGKSYGFDAIYFKKLVNWGTFDEAQFAERAVHLQEHPLHAQFLEILRSPKLASPGVTLGNLKDLQLA